VTWWKGWSAWTRCSTAGHFLARLDLAYPARRLGLEYDGDHHRDRVTFQRDIRRLNRLRLLGWTVLRFTADDVLRNPDRVVAYVRARNQDRSRRASIGGG
jgi:very-short-patch-repair endonuclease